MRCLSKSPEARPQSAAKLRELLLATPEANQWSEVEASTWWRNLNRSELPSDSQAGPTDPLALTIEARHFETPSGWGQ
jgi:hypothetical protein